MDNEIKQFLIKLVSIVLSLIFLYYLFSPYQNCMNAYDHPYYRGDMELEKVRRCLEITSW